MITLCIHQTTTDPYFNLAAEEYFLKNYREDFFMLWRSVPTVVVGKHQNALAEINHRFVQAHRIPVARRLSGGGTVFHDLGNLNFTFIRSVEKVHELSFRDFTLPIVQALQVAGVEAYTTGRNDLQIEGKKISGNAEHVHKNRVLHHGTLLYNSELQALKGTLNVDLSRFEGKAVQSNRSEVTNIACHLSDPMKVEDFGTLLFEEIMSRLPGVQQYEPTLSDRQAIEKLSEEKYRTWDWIYGYSPRYRYTHHLETQKGAIHLSLSVEKGLIVEASICGAISTSLSQQLAKEMLECRHDSDEIKSRISGLHSLLLTEGIDSKALLNVLF
ncbi:MAG TPA: lipoate--protein ligase [Prolixibacteraceae bacterium]|nr:lipoate--protein ligase [Prolixibacteraceae bacterium]